MTHTMRSPEANDPFEPAALTPDELGVDEALSKLLLDIQRPEDEAQKLIAERIDVAEREVANGAVNPNEAMGTLLVTSKPLIDAVIIDKIVATRCNANPNISDSERAKIREQTESQCLELIYAGLKDHEAPKPPEPSNVIALPVRNDDDGWSGFATRNNDILAEPAKEAQARLPETPAQTITPSKEPLPLWEVGEPTSSSPEVHSDPLAITSDVRTRQRNTTASPEDNTRSTEHGEKREAISKFIGSLAIRKSGVRLLKSTFRTAKNGAQRSYTGAKKAGSIIGNKFDDLTLPATVVLEQGVRGIFKKRGDSKKTHGSSRLKETYLQTDLIPSEEYIALTDQYNELRELRTAKNFNPKDSDYLDKLDAYNLLHQEMLSQYGKERFNRKTIMFGIGAAAITAAGVYLAYKGIVHPTTNGKSGVADQLPNGSGTRTGSVETASNLPTGDSTMFTDAQLGIKPGMKLDDATKQRLHETAESIFKKTRALPGSDQFETESHNAFRAGAHIESVMENAGNVIEQRDGFPKGSPEFKQRVIETFSYAARLQEAEQGVSAVQQLQGVVTTGAEIGQASQTVGSIAPFTDTFIGGSVGVNQMGLAAMVAANELEQARRFSGLKSPDEDDDDEDKED